jgi:hypothetical protein
MAAFRDGIAALVGTFDNPSTDRHAHPRSLLQDHLAFRSAIPSAGSAALGCSHSCPATGCSHSVQLKQGQAGDEQSFPNWQALKEKREPVLLLQPSDGGLATERVMTTNLVPIARIHWQATAQFVKDPLLESIIILPPVISKGAFQFAVRLWMTDRSMNEPDPKIRAKG